jgi:hypothetical protein
LCSMRKAVGDILRAENNLINQLSASRKAIVEKIKSWKPEEKENLSIDSFLFKGDSKDLNSIKLKDLFEIISER